MADYKLYLGELLVGRAKEQVEPEPYDGNYVKIDKESGSSWSFGSGSILKVGSNYNPNPEIYDFDHAPKVLYSDGTLVDMSSSSIFRSYHYDYTTSLYLTVHGEYVLMIFLKDNIPTSWTYSFNPYQ